MNVVVHRFICAILSQLNYIAVEFYHKIFLVQLRVSYLLIYKLYVFLSLF